MNSLTIDQDGTIEKVIFQFYHGNSRVLAVKRNSCALIIANWQCPK
jgi:hypothetical protein